MKNIEELLWAYIDGSCSAEEERAISAEIATDVTVHLKYLELLELNKEFAQIELEEPSMAFTFNVIETIREQEAAKPLKAHINRKIIMGITLFFTLTIALLLIYTFDSMNWSFLTAHAEKTKEYKIPDLSAFISKPVKEGFLFFDLVLAMFLFDNFLRRKKNQLVRLNPENINQ